MKYFLIAGEASGDLHASHLMAALRAQDSEAEFRFFGGDEMARAAGHEPLRHYKTLAYMGLVQVALHLRTILRGMKQCKIAIKEWRPDCVILVDYPGFNLKIAKYVHQMHLCPVYYYISPKIWAWKEGRIRQIKRDVDHLYSILPFEVDFFERRHNYPITYVGNPTVDEIAALPCPAEAPDSRPVIALLPGSRTAEIRTNLPLMLQAAEPYWQQGYDVVVAGAPSQPIEMYEGAPRVVFGETFQLLQRATAALVTSGTATLETAILGVPQVVCYHIRGGRIINWGKPYVLKVPYISLPNLICQREIIPELIAADLNPRNLQRHLAAILPGGESREQQLQDYADLRARLGEPGAPQRCAADIVRRLQEAKNAPKKILLVGDYSNVHATLAKGLRMLGHSVTVVSDGDGWKDYPRDVDVRREKLSLWYSLRYMWRLRRIWRTLKGYDVVQIINPVFLPLKAERMWHYYKLLRQQNKRMFMGAFGMDHYWVKAGIDCQTFRYSDFNMGAEVRADIPENKYFVADWLNGAKGSLNRRVAADCDGIIAGLYEYYASYERYCPQKDKLTFIPFPIILPDVIPSNPHQEPSPSLEGEGRQSFGGVSGGESRPVRYFIGIQRSRSAYKGTDIMLRALERLASEMPDCVEAVKVESVPFEEYRRLMDGSDVILDQLYSYTPAMNALEAMARGLIVVGGGEPENYTILGEDDLRPIINVAPTEQSVYEALRDLTLHPERIPQLKRDSREYVRRHHDYLRVAQCYLDFWSK